MEVPDHDIQPEEDDTLMLLLMCCHPLLSKASAIALTLRAVGGLTTLEIANAFIVPEKTMAQRISRAKQRIKESEIRFRFPDEDDIESRILTVQHVLYLIFNEGYTSSSGPALQRTDLSAEAIRLTRLLHRLQPGNAETAGLLALMLLTDARRPARAGAAGELVPLMEQDRSLWHEHRITEGIAILTDALRKGMSGPYQLQAAISALHDEAKTPEETDWSQILALYESLRRMSDNPMITLNYAVAEAMVHGSEKGLETLETLDRGARIADYYRLDAVRAHLLERSGDIGSAVTHYRRAAGKTASLPERNYLLMRAARLADEAG